MILLLIVGAIGWDGLLFRLSGCGKSNAFGEVHSGRTGGHCVQPMTRRLRAEDISQVVSFFFNASLF